MYDCIVVEGAGGTYLDEVAVSQKYAVKKSHDQNNSDANSDNKSKQSKL